VKVMDCVVCFFVFCIVVQLCGAVTSDTFNINNMEDFYTMYQIYHEKQPFRYDVIELNCDLDFNEFPDEKIVPIGQKTIGDLNEVLVPFNKTLHGNGHTIKNLVMSYGYTDGNDAALICRMDGAVITDLNFDKSCFFNGTYAGALAGKIMGGARPSVIRNVNTSATVMGGAAAGGLVGVIGFESIDPFTVTLESCYNFGNVSVPFSMATREYCAAGGLAGTWRCNGTITDCHNYGPVSTDYYRITRRQGSNAGGIIGQVWTCTKANLKVEGCTNNGTIAAHVNYITWADTSVSAGGIFGTITHECSPIWKVEMNDCKNYGDIEAVSDFGEVSASASGIVGDMYIPYSSEVNMKNCYNSGNIKAASITTRPVMGAGMVVCSDYSIFKTLYVDNCINDGNITSQKKAYGITNKAVSVTNCDNTGFLSATCESFGVVDSCEYVEESNSTGGIDDKICDAPPTNCHLDDGHCSKYGECEYGRIPGFEGENYCYEAVCDGTKWVIQKRNNATSWEKQSDDCILYTCDNVSGPRATSTCRDWYVDVQFSGEFEVEVTRKIVSSVLDSSC